MSDTDSNKLFSYKKYLTEGILLLGVTIFVHALSFAYDYGYGSFFNIPSNFISFSTSNLYTTLFVLIFGVASILLYYFNNFKLKRKDDKKTDKEYHNFFTNFNFLLITTAIYAIYHQGIWWLWIIPAVLLGWMILRHIILPYFLERGDTFNEKLRSDLKTLGNRTDTITDLMFSFPVQNITIYVFIVLALFGFVVNFGSYKAHTQTSYFVPLEMKGYVVARFYDDKAILINIKENKLGSKIKIVSSTDGKYTFEYKKIGKLSE